MNSPCKCGERGLDDLVLCSIRGKRYTVQCKVCGAQWTTTAKYAANLALDYTTEAIEAFKRTGAR